MARLFFLSLTLLCVARQAFGQPPALDGEPPPSFASIDSALTFRPTYFRASVDVLSGELPDTDSVTVLVVGTVSGGRYPIQGLPTDQPGMEVTFAVTDLDYVTWALWDSWDGEYGGLSYEFESGWFRVYADDSPDANLADPASFQDGEVLLEGTMSYYITGLKDCYFCGGYNAGIVEFSGGSLFPTVSKDGAGYRGYLTHILEDPGEPASSLGYLRSGDGSLMLLIPVPVHPTTWGQIKARYR
jgi:hypothetical protein